MIGWALGQDLFLENNFTRVRLAKVSAIAMDFFQNNIREAQIDLDKSRLQNSEFLGICYGRG